MDVSDLYRMEMMKRMNPEALAGMQQQPAQQDPWADMQQSPFEDAFNQDSADAAPTPASLSPLDSLIGMSRGDSDIYTPQKAEPMSGKEREQAESNSANDIMEGLRANGARNREEDKNLMWLNFFGKLASSSSPSLLGGLGEAAGSVAPTAIALKKQQRDDERDIAKLAYDRDYKNRYLDVLSQKNANNTDSFTVQKDALGNLFKVNKRTGEVQSVNPNGGGLAQPYNPEAQTPVFGFDDSQLVANPAALKDMIKTDQARAKSANSNRAIVDNANRALDSLEPNLDKFNSGAMAGTRLAGDKLASYLGADSIWPSLGTSAVAGSNIEKGTNDLATELSKFEYVPGNRTGALGLKTILGSKPSIDQPNETNKNITAGIRAKLTDYQLSEELADQYRQASPYKIATNNANLLDDALKKIYPIESVDQKTGATIFHPENVEKIRNAIPDAISNPKKYFEAAKVGGKGNDINVDPGSSNIPNDAINHLRQNPLLAKSFEAKYGVSADQYLR